ncbi:MAG TPA: GNAT family N-acetyltransferase [Acidimicrobiaceae bacterium]|jgi:GNAT superfamily N-acetyltransferase|nr:GNAT family N-acetyltransferase [Acidimicrobiaceae bacterium]
MSPVQQRSFLSRMRPRAPVSSLGHDMAMTTVRHAVRRDLDTLADTLGEAFTDDPMMAWMYPEAAARPAQSRQFMRTALDIGLPHGHVYATDGDHAAAIWSPPDIELFDDEATGLLFTMLGEQLGPGADAVGAGLMAINALHPHDEPHFYLFVIGAARRGAGLGSVLLRKILAQCDQQGIGAYLESSNTRNVPFYERHGFRVIAEEPIAAGFTSRAMWRDPQPMG